MEPDQSPLPDSSALEAGILPDSRAPEIYILQDDVRDFLRAPAAPHITEHAERLPPYLDEDGARSPLDVKCSSIFEDYAAGHEGSPSEKTAFFPSLLEYYCRSPCVDLETGTAVFPLQKDKSRDIPRLAHRRRTRRKRDHERDARAQVLSCVGLTCFLSALVAAYISQAVPPRTLHPALHAIFVIAILTTTVGLAYFTARLTKRTRSVPRHLWAVRRTHHRGNRHRHHHHRHRPRTPVSPTASITSSAGLLHTPPDLLPTPPAARIASFHSALAGGYYTVDFKPRSPDGTPTKPAVIHSPQIVEIDAEMAQLPTYHADPAPIVLPDVASPISPIRHYNPYSPRRISQLSTPRDVHNADTLLPATTFVPSPLRPRRHNDIPDPTPMMSDNDDEEGSIPIQAPPPAYGRWRGSVRVDPDFLRWGRLLLRDVETGDRGSRGGGESGAVAGRTPMVEVFVDGEQSEEEDEVREDVRRGRMGAEGGVTLVAEIHHGE